jgi:hypothetical protein
MESKIGSSRPHDVHSAAKNLNKTPNRNVVLRVKENKVFYKKQPNNIMLEVTEQGIRV